MGVARVANVRGWGWWHAKYHPMRYRIAQCMYVLINAHQRRMDEGNPFTQLFSSGEAVRQATETARAQRQSISDVLTKIFLITINQIGELNLIYVYGYTMVRASGVTTR